MLHEQLFGFEVLLDGRPLREYAHTDGKTYIAGKTGGHYSLRLINRTGRRVLCVCTVDGLSIMNGQPGDLNGQGYVLPPNEPAEIPGWRLSDKEVAAFVFGGPDASYAAKMGKPQNIGVIGCAIFEEKVRTPVLGLESGGYTKMQPPLDAGELTRGGSDAFGGGMTRGLGTGFGERTEHRVSRTTFERQDAPACVLALQYDDAASLRKQGIRVEKVTASTPNPFPATSGSSDGCEPPDGWEGRPKRGGPSRRSQKAGR